MNVVKVIAPAACKAATTAWTAARAATGSRAANTLHRDRGTIR
jgi:hypothetical protein